jgi:taspase (threonine aspartase 1)
VQSGVARMIAEAVEDDPEEEDVHNILRTILVNKFYSTLLLLKDWLPMDLTAFIEKWKSRGEPQPDVGVLLLRKCHGGSKGLSCISIAVQHKWPMASHPARLWCAFTTPSMAIAYATSEHNKPKVPLLSIPPARLLSEQF